MIAITWNQNIQPHNQAEIEKHIRRHLWLVPDWVEAIHFNLWDGDDYARDQFDLLCPKAEAEKFNSSMQKALRERHESATCDLMKALWNKLK